MENECYFCGNDIDSEKDRSAYATIWNKEVVEKNMEICMECWRDAENAMRGGKSE
jgi:hypothetical protein